MSNMVLRDASASKNVSMADMDLDILRMQRSTNPATFSIIVQNGRGGEGQTHVQENVVHM